MDNKITLQFVTYENMGSHIEYKIVVKDSSNQTYEMQSRYRVLRDIYTQLKVNLDLSELPEFPPKRLFGNMNLDFIAQRQKDLENFFNRLLQKFSIDELQPLKNFLSLKRESSIRVNNQPSKKDPEPMKSNPPKPVTTVPVVSRPPISVIDQFKRQFFDLNDTFAPPDMEDPEVRRKKNRYESNIKIEINNENDLYKLPLGNESNLISIQDDTLVTHNQKLMGDIANTLESVRKNLKAIYFPNVNKMIVSLE